MYVSNAWDNKKRGHMLGDDVQLDVIPEFTH